jgi:beta-lactamase class A
MRRRFIMLALLLVGLGVATFFVFAKSNPKPTPPQPVKTVHKKTPLSEKPALLPVVNVQPTIDNWLATQPADYGIAVYDPASKQMIGVHQADKPYFTASIYKLYVAYAGLLDIEAGKTNAQEPYLNGMSREQCIFEMIHSSNSPCAEKLMGEIGATRLNTLLISYGFKNTTFPGLTTTAADTTVLLQRLQAKQDLQGTHTQLLRQAMQTQIYRNGMPKGMTGATVYDKVGFNEDKNYHDVGIVALPNGREYIICIFSQNQGSSRPIASLSQSLYTALIK